MATIHGTLAALGAAALALGIAAPATAVTEGLDVTPETRVVPPEELSREVAVRDVRVDDGAVSGTVVNTSGRPIRDVKLLVRYTWLWKNERRPGTNPPGHLAYYTLPGELRPGESREFTYRPETPLPARRDGRFAPSVDVAELVATTPAAGAPSPTAGRP